MIDRPVYFEHISRKAAQRWAQLEKDPELAGPWRQLFNQVQIPRHVLSELLQNADDAEANEASVDIDGDEFVFSHNGHDFIEEHFASLCSFGYSNKRALHTIGFRGVGFKSTFSLGDEVRLYTPTLSVAFHRRRFTEPVWIERNGSLSHRTEIRVPIKDDHRRRELERNMEEWRQNSASLLFFRCIRCLRIGGQEVRWVSKGLGPVKNSEWMALSTNPDTEYLLLRSVAENFPDDTIEEIREERMLSTAELTSFPPCRVEIILGMEGRLFVILPTGVNTKLPFACNGPFLQDPGRLKIKAPEISPTNRWLLQRAGELAAKSMLQWLRRKDLDIEDRCKAYALFPDVDRRDSSLEGCCAKIVEEAFEETVTNEKFLLTENQTLVPSEQCISVPHDILEIWPARQISKFFDKDKRLIINRNISIADRKKLKNRKVFDEVTKADILDVLESKHLPRPGTWPKLLALWVFVSDDVEKHFWEDDRRGVRIVPVHGKKVLYASKDVVRLSEKKQLHADDDWEFLSEHLLVVNPNWLRYLTKQRRKAEQRKDGVLRQQVESASAVLKALNLNERSDVDAVIRRTAREIFSQEDCGLDVCVRLAQIAAKLNASTDQGFEFVTRDNCRRSVDQQLVADTSGDLDQFAAREWCEEHVLHDRYRQEFVSCTENEWERWVASGRSGLLTFVQLTPIRYSAWGRTKIQRLLRERGYKRQPHFPYNYDKFDIDDWDFDEELWDFWKTTAGGNGDFWAQLFGKIMRQPKAYWSEALSAKITQIARNGWQRELDLENLPSSWVAKFRSLPCLRDTWGSCHQPAELFLHTPQTEPLLDVEPFVHLEDDIEQTRPLLLKLGVRSTPTGPARLLERVRALAAGEEPPIDEVEKWYHRLDNLINECTTEELEEIKDTFAKEKIILTENISWARPDEVFLSADEEDVPGAALVHPSVRHLSLWHKVGVADRPTADLAMKWLGALTSGHPLSQDELRRVHSLLPKYPDRIWNECRHWVNLESEWAPVDQLAFSLTRQSLVPWKHLFKAIKQKTADLQKLPAQVCQRYPFADLRSLSQSIEDRFQEPPAGLPEPQNKPWMATLAGGLMRIILDDEDETTRVRELAIRLADTRWQVASGLETAPYIDGTPAGTRRRINALWKDSLLFVKDPNVAKMAKSVPQELGRVFNNSEISEAIRLCYERPPEFVIEYLEENFKLLPEDEVGLTGGEPTPGSEVDVVTADAEDTTTGDTTSEESFTSQDGKDEPKGEYDGGESDTQEDGFEDTDLYDEFKRVATDKDEKDITGKSSRKHPKPAKSGLMERFAKIKGYTKVDSGRFSHPDGSRIQKTSENSFPWQMRSSSGELRKCYWAKDHCIEHEPLQLDASVWGLCEKHPHKYSLLLTDPEGDPVEFSGQLLLELRDSGRLILYPARYRLVYDSNKGAHIHARI